MGAQAPIAALIRAVEGGTDTAEQKIAIARTRPSDALREVRGRAPKSRVHLVGYAAILPSDGTDRGRELPLAPGDFTNLREKERQLSATPREQAKAAGATYADTYTPSERHDACSAEGDARSTPSSPAAPRPPSTPTRAASSAWPTRSCVR